MPPALPLNAWLRYDCVARELARLPGVDSVLEVGVGLGAVGARLALTYRYVGLEPSPESCEIARRNIEPAGGRVICGDIGALAPGEKFAVVAAFEVIEHIEDDHAVLAAWRAHVRPRGWVMLSAPPFQARYGPHDRSVGHYRRYEPQQMRKLLEESGFSEVRILLYGFPLGFALETARHVIARASDQKDKTMAEQTALSGRLRQPAAWLGPVTQGLTLPFRLLQRPFLNTELGTGLLAVARLTE